MFSGDLPGTPTWWILCATTKVDNTIRFGTVSDTKEMEFAGTDIIVKEMKWTSSKVTGQYVQVENLNLIKTELETNQYLRPPTV